jgi:hypothetical protein
VVTVNVTPEILARLKVLREEYVQVFELVGVLEPLTEDERARRDDLLRKLDFLIRRGEAQVG